MRPLALPCVLLLLALASCRHDEAERTPKIQMVPNSELTPRERAESKLMLDLGWAQRIERGRVRGFGPEDSVSVYVNGKERHFANVHQFRLNIRHRWDSLKATGSALDYDTTTQPGPLVRDSTAVFIPQ